jgi:hypothetical protein
MSVRIIMIPNAFKDISLKDSLEIIKSVFNILAVIIGAIWGYRLFWLKRQKYPRINISHQIVHKSLTADKNLLNVTVNLLNDGDVLVRLKSGEVWVQQILPLPRNFSFLIDEGKDVIKVLRDAIPDESREMWQTEAAWPVVSHYSVNFRAWHKKEVEPGSSLQLRYDFILDSKIKLIKVYSFYENAAKDPVRVGSRRWKFWAAKKYTVGWESAVIYNLK